jgi:hypothetical protein
VLIWEREQCFKTFGSIVMDTPYCLKDLTKVYFACCGLPYGKEKETLFIDDESHKALQNPSKDFCQNITWCNGWTRHPVYGQP